MLCQKCGRTKASVHLESVVFRQKVEEHLCEICAGVRKPERVGPELDPVQSYLSQFAQLPNLTHEEQVALVSRFQQARTAGEEEEAKSLLAELIEANLRVVIAIAKGYLNHGVEFIELVNAGNQGLLKGLQKLSDQSADEFVRRVPVMISKALAKAVASTRRSKGI